MAAGPVRLAVGIAATALLTTLAATPASAADCALVSPESIAVGDQLTIVGSGFAAHGLIGISITIDGATSGEFRVSGDASGAFQVSLTPETADAGRMVVTADDGSCSAQASVFVLLPGQTMPATPAAEAEVPDAGGPTGSGAPRTDGFTASASASPSASAWLLGSMLLVLGLSGRILTRPRRR